MYPGFQCYPLDAHHRLWQGRLPPHLLPNSQQFEHLWTLHPSTYHTIKVYGHTVATPRWEQAYQRAYCYSGVTHAALPVPLTLYPLWRWAQTIIDSRLNGIVLSWYDARLGHYIGKHRDSRQQLIQGAPIVTISLGHPRVLRLRPWRGQGYQDFPLAHGTVCLLPYDTNLAWTHEVPAAKRFPGRRIAMSLRAFADEMSGQ
ncbi:hypothetical protein XM38_047500 [Halomicronema hongdechloris C2206]|uniref:Fe2OG dioxygenase domain-containing protein n=1 Tax=Halomicronema hongdechloris C2206 TaxID=1641165 RepID=A0A1Z3HTX8_9CYAN|nr:alpha-ketoglutarate-dependent dioxygenase AlkB [Halomicronema hongdechloris]ASC73778.1 hypothetical protein XM38_047500 [Halomicronema hongdechloris C2206]